jgi:hypothetical protein
MNAGAVLAHAFPTCAYEGFCAASLGNPASGSFVGCGEGKARPHNEVSNAEMLQNKKAALISGGSKSFVSVRRCEKKVTE